MHFFSSHTINHSAFPEGYWLGVTCRKLALGVDYCLDYSIIEFPLSTIGRLAGAGLDVYPDEPHIAPALLQHEKIVCTPHIGTNTVETRFLMARTCSEQVLCALAGQRPENIVNGL